MLTFILEKGETSATGFDLLAPEEKFVLFSDVPESLDKGRIWVEYTELSEEFPGLRGVGGSSTTCISFSFRGGIGSDKFKYL